MEHDDTILNNPAPPVDGGTTVPPVNSPTDGAPDPSALGSLVAGMVDENTDEKAPTDPRRIGPDVTISCDRLTGEQIDAARNHAATVRAVLLACKRNGAFSPSLVSDAIRAFADRLDGTGARVSTVYTTNTNGREKARNGWRSVGAWICNRIGTDTANDEIRPLADLVGVLLATADYADEQISAATDAARKAAIVKGEGKHAGRAISRLQRYTADAEKARWIADSHGATAEQIADARARGAMAGAVAAGRVLVRRAADDEHRSYRHAGKAEKARDRAEKARAAAAQIAGRTI
jgi:hypothetical protein